MVGDHARGHALCAWALTSMRGLVVDRRVPRAQNWLPCDRRACLNARAESLQSPSNKLRLAWDRLVLSKKGPEALALVGDAAGMIVSALGATAVGVLKKLAAELLPARLKSDSYCVSLASEHTFRSRLSELRAGCMYSRLACHLRG